MIPFHVPPLRERREDIPLLARHFIAELSAEYGKRAEGARAARPWTLLVAQPWPGNVRELRNIIERLVIMTPGDRIEARHLPASLLGPRRAASASAAAAPPPAAWPTSRPWPRPARTSRSATSGRSTRSAAAT